MFATMTQYLPLKVCNFQFSTLRETIFLVKPHPKKCRPICSVQRLVVKESRSDWLSAAGKLERAPLVTLKLSQQSERTVIWDSVHIGRLGTGPR